MPLEQAATMPRIDERLLTPADADRGRRTVPLENMVHGLRNGTAHALWSVFVLHRLAGRPAGRSAGADRSGGAAPLRAAARAGPVGRRGAAAVHGRWATSWASRTTPRPLTRRDGRWLQRPRLSTQALALLAGGQGVPAARVGVLRALVGRQRTDADGARRSRAADPASRVDTVGDGDAFSAMMLAGLALGHPLACMLGQAVAFASLGRGWRGGGVRKRCTRSA